MVKGVNKTVIEVNNTGSKYFEKIVFYVTPQYGNLSAKQLKRAASTFSFNFDNSLHRKPLRKFYKMRKLTFLILTTVISISVIGAIMLLLFK